jgi:glycosyltransferase involved in cell wall biosynthesis
LLKGLDRNEFLITLVIYEGVFAYSIPDKTAIEILDIRSSRNVFKFLINFILKIIRIASSIRRNRPDIIYSLISSTNVTVVLAKVLSRLSGKLILSEHSHPSQALKNNYNDRITAYLMKYTYPKTEKIIAVSEEIQQDLIKNFNILPGKVKVIYNPVDIREIETLSHEKVDHHWFNSEKPVIISIGRLTKQKGYQYLIEAFSIVKRSFPCKIVIIGEGEEKAEMISRVRSLGIESDVAFLGFQKNPFKYMVRSSVFVLSSLCEGFPNVILEAMSLGLPVVSTDCPSGPSEIIEDKRNGLLVPVKDNKALAQAILDVLTNDKLRKNLSLEARERAQSFELNNIIEQYRGIFLENPSSVI